MTTTPDIVERYDLDGYDAGMVARADGEYCKASDAIAIIERLRAAANESEERIADLVAQAGELNLSYHQNRTRLAAAEKVVEAAEQAESVMPAHTTSKERLRAALTAYAAARVRTDERGDGLATTTESATTAGAETTR